MVDAVERAVPVPQVEILPNRAAGRQVLRQRLPLAPRPEHVKDGVQDLSDVHGPRPPAAFGRADERRDQRPFRIGHVAGIAQPPSICRCPMLRLPHRSPSDSERSRESQPTLTPQLLPGWALRDYAGSLPGNRLDGVRPLSSRPAPLGARLAGLLFDPRLHPNLLPNALGQGGTRNNRGNGTGRDLPPTRTRNGKQRCAPRTEGWPC